MSPLPFRRVRTRLLGVVVVLLVAWRAAAGVRVLFGEPALPVAIGSALAWGDVERMDHALQALEARVGMHDGSLRRLHAALQARLGPDGSIHVLHADDGWRRAAAACLLTLCFPARIFELREMPADGPKDSADVGADTFVLELEPRAETEERLLPWFEVCEESADFRLWRGRAPAR